MRLWSPFPENNNQKVACFPDNRCIKHQSCREGYTVYSSFLFTLVCSPRVRKNKMRWVMKRRRCPGRLLLLLESHLLNSSIRPISHQSKDATIGIKIKRRDINTIQGHLLYSYTTTSSLSHCWEPSYKTDSGLNSNFIF